MNPEVKTLWLEALRSSEYPQGQFWLKSADGAFCPLGVLCDLHRRWAKRDRRNWVKNKYTGNFVYGIHELGVLPPLCVVQWADLPDPNPVLRIDKNGKHCVSSLNDAGATFESIAKLIERKL